MSLVLGAHGGQAGCKHQSSVLSLLLQTFITHHDPSRASGKVRSLACTQILPDSSWLTMLALHRFFLWVFSIT